MKFSFPACSTILLEVAVMPAAMVLATIQATVETDVAALITNLVLNADAGIVVESVVLRGGDVCSGLFTGGHSVSLDIPNSGVILSSGDVTGIEGPNNYDAYTTVLDTPGDSDLDSLVPGSSTNDACILQFDFSCPPEWKGPVVVEFKYIFASEEYNEYVDTDYSDIFGFFLNGENIAVVPDGSGNYVTITNVNKKAASEYYHDNDIGVFSGSPPHAIQANGFTSTFTATAITKDGLNTMKIAIADVGDSSLDSWVLLQAGSFTCRTRD